MNDTNLLEKTSNSCIKTEKSHPQLRIDAADDHYLDTKQHNNLTMSSSPGSSPSPPSSPTTMNRASLPRLYRIMTASKILLATLILFSLASIYIMLDSFQHHQRDVSGCQTSYMRPEYIKQTNFDSEMTRFAGKYGLYLYREKGVDYSDQVRRKRRNEWSAMDIDTGIFFSTANGCASLVHSWARRQLQASQILGSRICILLL